jgi:hypothetical protein
MLEVPLSVMFSDSDTGASGVVTNVAPVLKTDEDEVP